MYYINLNIMCGITGVITNNCNVASKENTINLINSLNNIQHRGQHSYGFSFNEHGCIIDVKGVGLIDSSLINHRPIKIGLGHVRYPTSGVLDDCEIQPLVSDNRLIALVHNGNISNYDEIKHKFNLKTNSDSELIIQLFENLISNYISDLSSLSFEIIEDIILKISNELKGSYSIIVMIVGYGLICFKDPLGIRPLVYAMNNNNFIVSSESVSFNTPAFSNGHEVNGGEFIIINNSGLYTKNYRPITNKPCIFEWVYLAREDSIIHGVSVYEARLKMGEYLAFDLMQDKSIDINQIDYVIPVPETSRPVAQRMAEVLNKPYREGIVKNRYVTRTFIMNNQYQRTLNISKKFGINPSVVAGKNIVVVDDSIVRGNTLNHIVKLLYNNKVKNIIVASSSSMIVNTNVYGLDIPTQTELLAYNKSIEDIENYLNVSKVVYLSKENMCKSVTDLNNKLTQFELSVFSN